MQPSRAGEAAPQADSQVGEDGHAKPPGTLDGDLAVVTGGVRGLGLAIAHELGRQGAHVVIADLDVDLVAQAVDGLRRIDIRADGVAMDVSDVTSVRAGAREVQLLGDTSILVNNAGIAGIMNIGEPGAIEHWDRVVDVNLSGAYYVTSAFLEQLKRTRGRIVNVSSVTAFTSGFTNTAYVASKGGIRSLTQMLARELAPHGIRVNAVAPGYFDTTMSFKGTTRGDAWIAWHCPMKRYGEPHEIGGPVAFLASPAASFINGVTLPVDGGYLVM